MVRTSPILIACPGEVSRTPLTRTWPDSTSSAAEVRAFTTRACHSHLSRRWRSVVVRLLLATGELLFQRGEFCKRRVRIDRTIALARVRTRRIGTERGTGLAVTAVAALVAVAATMLTAALAELALAP